MSRLENLAGQCLDAAKAAGAEAADVLVADGRAVSVEVRGGALEHVERAEGVDLGLRVLIGARQACVSVSDVSAEGVAAMAARAVAMAREAPEDETCGLADPSLFSARRDAGGLNLTDGQEAAPAALQEAALVAEAAALAVPGVAQTQNAGAAFSQTELVLASSNGFLGSYGRGIHSRSCVAISGEGLAMERDWFGDARTHLDDLFSAEDVGRIAGERAAERAGARRPPTGAFPVLFDERIAASLIGHLAAAINGTAIVRGASFLKDALGEQVLPRGLSLTEDPLRPRVAGSRPFDGEGLAVAPRALVDDGVLQGWTLDLATARKLGMQSTGNASRGMSSPPAPASGNLLLTQGTDTRDDLIAQMGTGLIVTSMIGSTINPNTGDYSRGASGFWVENGEITGPVNECTVAGNLRDMLKSLRPANDARVHLSRVVPSLLVEGLVIAGA